MKLMIDIPYEAYYTFKCDLGKGNLNALAEIVAKGTPYEERPQGEWYYGEDECGQDGWFCSECGFFVPWYYTYYENDINFIREYKVCPHCLAEMVTYIGKDRDTKGGAA